MPEPRFFRTTRGRILTILKKENPCTISTISQRLGLSKNAIRQHLDILERDRLVAQKPLKSGPGKPAFSYSLTPLGEETFPKEYGLLLDLLLQKLQASEKQADLSQILFRIGNNIAEPYLDKVRDLKPREKIAEVVRIMESRGGIAEWERRDDTLYLENYNCPFARVVQQHAQVCQVQRGFLERLFRPSAIRTMCNASSGRCLFEVHP